MKEDYEDIIKEGENRGQLEGEAKLGCFIEDGKNVNAKNVCVLVVDYDFKEATRVKSINLSREGNEKDVENLEYTFKKRRNCNFRRLFSPSKEFLLTILADKDNLLRYFSSTEVPSVFVLYVLSHGGTEGVIMTDHYKSDDSAEFVSFTTTEIFESLKKLPGFENCLKIINFGPCRGDWFDMVYSANQQKEDHEYENSCRITYSPQMHNLVVFYSSVECNLSQITKISNTLRFTPAATRARRNPSGTTFGLSSCQVLNSMEKDEPLINILAMVQYHIHKDTEIFESKIVGQTPEVKMFSLSKKFVISKSASPSSRSTSDASGVRTKQGIYPWEASSGEMIRHRRAFLLFTDFNEYINQIKNALQNNLDFDTTERILNTSSLERYFQEVSRLESDIGCVLSIFFGQVCEHEDTNEVCVLVDNSEMKFSDILQRFVGPKNEKWIGKPKLFIIIDQSATGTDDGLPPNHNPVISATYHSGWLVLVLHDKESLEKLINILMDQNLKRGKSLQEELETLLISGTKSNKNLLCSTLQFLLSFPDQPKSFVKLHFSVQESNKESTVLTFDKLLNKVTKEARIYLLSSIAGAGKSTFLRELASHLGRCINSYNILFLQLPKVSFSSFASKKKIGKELNFLAAASLYSEEEIETWVDNKKCMILLDGYDEISSESREMILKLIKYLNEKNICVLIGTRPHEAEAIQKVASNAVRVQIKPLGKEQQLELLQIHTGKTEDECELFIKKFKQKGILENPLYLILVAQCDSEGNLYQIFDQVVRQKVELALVRKGFDKSQKEKFEEKFKLAMKLLQEVAYRFMNGENLVGPDKSKEDSEKINSLGIATFEGHYIYFIHQTFAEFLAAQKYIRDMEDNEAFLSFDEGSISSNLFYGKRLKKCREFVDHYYSTLKDNDIIEIHSDAIQLAAKWKPNEFLKIVVRDGLVHTLRILKPFIKFNESQTGSICFVRNWSLFKDATKNAEEIASQLIELDIIKDEDQLLNVLPYLFKLVAFHDAISTFQKIMEKFPSWRELIRSGSHVIFDIARSAAKEGHFQIIDFLLQNGVLKENKEYGSRLIYVAITTGNIEFVKSLLNHGMYEAINDKGKSNDPLKVAVLSGHLDMVRFLLEEKVEGFERNGETFEIEQFKGNRNVFHCSVFEGYKDIAKYLLSKSPSIKNVNTMEGESPLQLAVRGYYCFSSFERIFERNFEICQWLVNEAGVDANTLFQSGDRNDWSEYEEQMDFYLMLQSDVNKKDARGKTPLHCAAEYGFDELVQSLIDRGANVQAKDENGMNAFHFACKNYGEVGRDLDQENNEKVLKLLHNTDGQLAKENTKSSKTSLHILIENSDDDDDISEVLRLLIEEYGVDISVKDNRGRTALSFAAKNKCIPDFDYLMTMLMSKDVDPTIKNNVGQSCLHLAAERDDTKFLQMWLDSGEDLNIEDYKGLTALHYAAQRGQLDFVKKLLGNGANSNATDFEGQTALHVACQHGRLEVIKCILDWKAPRISIAEEKARLAVADKREWNALHHSLSNIDVFLFIHEKNPDLLGQRLKNGDTILHVAIQANSDFKVVDWLLQQSEVDLNAKNNKNKSALLMSFKEKKWAFAKMLMDKNVDVNLTDRDGNTALHFAVRSGDLDLVQKLISARANLTLKDHCGMNAFHHAMDNLQIVKYIHEKDGRLVKQRLKNGNTSLHLAIESGEFDVIQWLIEQQVVDLNAVNNENQSPLLLACKKENWKTVEMLLTKNVDVNVLDGDKKSALHYVIESKKVHLVQMILESGADLTVVDKSGQNYLHYATSNLQIIKLIFKINNGLVKQLLSNEETFLHLAIKSYDPYRRVGSVGTCNDDVIRWLVEQDGVDLNAKNASGKTALLLACQLCRWEAAKILLTKNIDVNVVDCDGKTAFHHMSLSGDLDLAQKFIENGANLSLTDKEGKNALHHAIHDFKMFHLILEKNNSLVHCRLENGDTILHLAISVSISDGIVTYCLSRPTSHYSKEYRNGIIFSIINQNGFDLNAMNNQNETPLLLACKENKWNVAELLLTKNVEVNAIGKDGKTALYYTAESLSCIWNRFNKVHLRNLVRSIIEKGADVPLTVDYLGRNVIHELLLKGYVDSFMLIHRKNVNLVKQQLENGNTILHSAIESHCKYKVIRLLVELLSIDDLNATNDEGTNNLVNCRLENGDTSLRSMNSSSVDEKRYKHFDSFATNDYRVVDVLNALNYKGMTPLMLACRISKWSVAELLLTANVDTNIQNRSGKTAFHYAAQSISSRSKAAIQNLILRMYDQGADLTLTDNEGYNVLYYLMKDLDTFKLLHGINSNLVRNRSNDGSTILHLAIEKDKFNVAEWLVEQNVVDLNATNDKGMTALMLAYKSKNWEVTQMLVDKNVDANIENSKGKLAIHYVTKSGNGKLTQNWFEMSVNKPKKGGKYCLHYAVTNLKMFQSIYEQNNDLAKQILTNEDTILHFAIKSYEPIRKVGTCNDDVIRWLVEQDGVDLNAKNSANQTALLLACKRSRWDVAKILLTKNIDVNVVDCDGKTASHHMAHSGDLNLARMFLEKGADLSLTDKEGKNALHHAINDLKMFHLILEKNVNLVHCRLKSGDTTLHLAIRSSVKEERGKYFKRFDYQIVENKECRIGIVSSIMLQSDEVDLNALNHKRETPLLLACRYGKLSVAELLLNANVDTNIKNRRGKTAFHYAASLIFRRSQEAKQSLILRMHERGANLTLTDNEGNNVLYYSIRDLDTFKLIHRIKSNLVKHRSNDGNTILHLAIEKVFKSVYEFTVAEWLVEQSVVDLDATNDIGMTALMLTCELKKWELAQMLLDKNVNVNIEDKRGKTALSYAKESEECDQEVLQALIERSSPVNSII